MAFFITFIPMVGHIKLDRKILEWEWYQDANVFRLFIHMLLIANHKDGKWQGNEIKRGQLITGLDKLSTSTGLSIMKIRTCFDKLKSTGEITIKLTSKYRVVTICKYDTYQSFKNENNNQINSEITDDLTGKQQASNKQVTANNNDNNEKKIIHSIYKPISENFNGLPEIKIGAVIQLLKITKQVNVTKDDVSGLWEIFKVQNLTGKKPYKDEDDVHSHFINWSKSQKTENGNKSISASDKSTGAASRRKNEALRDY